VLNPMSVVTTAAETRGRFSVGVLLMSGTGTFQPAGAVAFPRHRAYWAECVSGQLGSPAGYGKAAGQQDPSKQHNPISTPVAAVRGGALGSHPAREPEPV
jgi:hypothetical protein